MMTYGEALTCFDNCRPNDFTDKEKLQWLYEIETRVGREIYGLEDFTPPSEFSPDTPLLAERADAFIYVSYMIAMASLALGEYEEYEVMSEVCNKFYGGLADYVNRCRMGQRPKTRFF